MFKSKKMRKMREVVEHELELTKAHLAVAKELNLAEPIAVYTAQEIELGYILHVIQKLGA